MKVKATWLLLKLLEKPKNTFPEHIRKMCMSLTKGKEAFDVFGNHQHTYSPIHYQGIHSETISLLAVGDAPSSAVLSLTAEIARRRDSLLLAGEQVVLRDMFIEDGSFEIKKTSRLHEYELITPLIVQNSKNCIIEYEKTSDKQKFYEDFLTNNARWIFSRLGAAGGDEVFVKVLHFKEENKRFREIAPKRPAVTQARLLVNAILPPAIGHCAVFGWGRIRALDM